jgi:hypothetical protein
MDAFRAIEDGAAHAWFVASSSGMAQAGVELKRMLRELQDEGLVAARPARCRPSPCSRC